MRENTVRGAHLLTVLGLLATGLLGFGCTPGGVGDPCVPEEEYNTNFGGFSVDEVNVESRSFQCLTRVCLVNHFQGRVSCPYGQEEATAHRCREPGNCLPGTEDHEASCRIPGQNGEDVNDRIRVAVDPQQEERQADQAVYCSCRCAGPDPNANYCECPSGFTCTELVEDLQLGSGQLAGSYCIKNGTRYNERATTTNCDRATGECGYKVGPEGAERGVNPPVD